MERSSEKGQILLIVVLIMVVALTVGLSIAANSLVNVKIATDDENSQRAFSAAEAGIERLIKTNCTGHCILNAEELDNGATFAGEATAIQGQSFLVKAGIEVKEDEGVDIWMSTYSPDPGLIYGNPRSGVVSIYWGNTGDDCSAPALEPAALEMIVFRRSGGSIVSDRYAVDPCDARNNTTSFSDETASGSFTVQGKPFRYQFTTQQINNGLMIRVVPIYKNVILGVVGGNGLSFPTQGKQIEATGDAGGTSRKVSYIQSFATIPNEFVQYSLLAR